MYRCIAKGEGPVAINRETHGVSLIVQPKETKKEEEVGTGVLPAVRYLTITLSSRELRRFRLVLLLISNECSSLVAATPTATNLCVCASAYSVFCIFPGRFSFFSPSPLSFPLSRSISLTLIPIELLYLSTFDNRNRRRVGTRRFARSLDRALAHPPFISLLNETPPFAESNIRRRHPRRLTILYLLYTNACVRTAHPGRMHGRPIRQ